MTKAKANFKQLIIDAAQVKFHENGFNGTGVQDIVVSAGVPKGSFYNHFESKEALGAEIIDIYFHRKARREVLFDKAIPPLERLRAYFETASAGLVESQFQRGCLIGNFTAELSGQSELVRNKLQNAWSLWTDDIQGVIAEAQADGSVKSTVPSRDLATFLLSAWEGSILRSKADKDDAVIKTFFEFAFKTILV